MRTAKILLLDIETLYMETDGIWDLRTDYISPDNITKDWSILCWGAKWLFEPGISGQSVTPKEAMNREEHTVIGGIWKMIDEADIVVTQNGEGFDIPRLNSKFLKWRLPRPAPYIHVDTLKVAKRNIYLPSYKLDWVGKNVLGIDGKIKMGMDDWRGCAKGDQSALDKMLTYCKRDIAPLLEDWYLYLLPFVKNQNLNIYPDHDSDVCPNCESTDLKWTLTYSTPQGRYEGFRCQSCGSIGRGTSKEKAIKKVQIKPV